MVERNLGLTQLYRLFHSVECQDADIQQLRTMHSALSWVVAECYGWRDVDLAHEFRENERGQVRFMLSPETCRQVINRLLALNSERRVQRSPRKRQSTQVRT